MNIQQDKRVIKPSKMSERYARWFGTRVPSTSPTFRYLLMFFLSIPASLIMFFLLMLLQSSVLAMAAITGFGAVIYLLYLTVLRIHFQSTITDSLFSQIMVSARSRVGASENIQIWPQKNTNAYIASTFNSLFDAIIVSDTMIDLIDQMPESGEVLLAYHLIRAPKGRNIVDTIAAVLIFFVSTIFFTYIVMNIILTAFYYPFVLLYILYTPAYALAPIFLIFALRAAFWTHDSAFEKTARLYGRHPQVAKDEVISSQKLDEEAARATIWVVREWEGTKRSGRRSSIAVLVFVLIFIIEYLYLMSFGILFYYSIMMYISLLIFLLPLSVGLVVFMVLRRWDKKCMAELYYTTKQADEPVWVD